MGADRTNFIRMHQRVNSMMRLTIFEGNGYIGR